MDVLQLINRVIAAEGGYSDHPHDTGGATMYGITERVARASGYAGDMRSLPRDMAVRIYIDQYYVAPGFDRVALLSPRIAFELTDTGVNQGPRVASEYLQRCLNVFNRQGRIYRDLLVDGQVGSKTISALRGFLAHREGGEGVLLAALNCLQGARYIDLAERREENESFVYGWMRERIRF